MKKVFLLGVGCQKGATTWLHNYLRAHPNTRMGFRKEYHVFDALYIPECAHFRTKNAAKVAADYRAARWFSARKQRNNAMHAALYAEPSLYFDYFRQLVADDPQITLTGDITPSYAGLPAEALRSIRDELMANDFHVKVVFLMRDPVGRCISAMRMHRNKYNSFTRSENDELRGLYATRDFEFRTRYEVTIANLEQVFPREDIHYEFYERLFRDESIRGITDFLNIPFRKPDFGKQVNTTKSKFQIDNDLLREVYQYYLPTYDFIAERHGRETMADIWSGYRRFGGLR